MEGNTEGEKKDKYFGSINVIKSLTLLVFLVIVFKLSQCNSIQVLAAAIRFKGVKCFPFHRDREFFKNILSIAVSPS